MVFSPEELNTIASLFGIPTIPEKRRTWIVRTQSGTYYEDFSRNKYIALGWDRIPLSQISDVNRLKENVIDYIKDEYPEEKRPGLIYGQLFDFVRVMVPGDYVVIPSQHSNYVNIGIIGELFEESVREQPVFIDDYFCCPYRLRRHVQWVRERPVSEDIYLAKMLRAQQTISDITKYAGLIYRNLFDFYYVDGTLSLTIRKKTDDTISFLDIAMLQGEIAALISTFDGIFGDDSGHEVEQKIALSSPGFLQFVMTKVKGFVPFVFFSQLFKSLGGKIQTADGQSLEGLPAYLQAVSSLFNDKADRDVKRAQAKKLLSEAGKIDAETEMARAETRKTNAETTTITLQNAKTMIELFGSHEVDTDSDKLDENVARLERELMSVEERYQRLEPILDRLGINPPMIESQESIVSLPVNREE